MESDLKIKHKLSLAGNFKTQGKYLHAIQICEQLLAEYSNNPDVHFELADLYELSGNLNSALRLLDNYLDSNPKDAEMRLFFGQFLIKNRLWQKAIEIFSEINPEEKPIALFLLGYSYFMIKDYEMARINYLSFVINEIENELTYESYFYLAKIEIELKEYKQALTYAKQSEILYSAFWELHLIYAKCYYNLSMETHAVLSIEKAIKLNPKEIILYEWAGKIFLRVGEYLNAEKYLTKFIDSAEEISSDTYSGLGEACMKTNKYKAASDYFELALRIDPNNIIALSHRNNISKKSELSLSNDD